MCGVVRSTVLQNILDECARWCSLNYKGRLSWTQGILCADTQFWEITIFNYTKTEHKYKNWIKNFAEKKSSKTEWYKNQGIWKLRFDCLCIQLKVSQNYTYSFSPLLNCFCVLIKRIFKWHQGLLPSWGWQGLVLHLSLWLHTVHCM